MGDETDAAVAQRPAATVLMIHACARRGRDAVGSRRADVVAGGGGRARLSTCHTVVALSRDSNIVADSGVGADHGEAFGGGRCCAPM